MFHNDQLAAALVFDHQTRLHRAATRRRLVRRNKEPLTNGPPVAVHQVLPAPPFARSGDTDRVLSPQRAHCAA